jgi:group I intron endonuclease
MGVIYQILNKDNGKSYIGQTSNKYPNTRWSMHKLNMKNNIKHPLYNSMKKYGVDKFEFIILEKNIVEKLNELEKKYIKKFNSIFPNGYNLTVGGEALRGEENPMFGKHGKLNPNYNNKWTDKMKKDLSEKMKGKPGMKGKDNPRYGKPGTFLGKHHTEESKIKNRLSQKTRVSIDMFKDNIFIKNFISQRETVKWIRKNTPYNKADCSTIASSIKNNWKCYGYKFNYGAKNGSR